jgi:adenylate cyclase
VNKLYGTGILLSADTASQLGDAVKVRPVDRVIVKGKSEPVEIFTPCGDDEAIDLTVRAIAAYRAREWDESERLWRAVAERLPGDGVAAVYLERLTRCRMIAANEPWEAAVELEKL